MSLAVSQPGQMFGAANSEAQAYVLYSQHRYLQQQAPKVDLHWTFYDAAAAVWEEPAAWPCCCASTFCLSAGRGVSK